MLWEMTRFSGTGTEQDSLLQTSRDLGKLVVYSRPIERSWMALKKWFEWGFPARESDTLEKLCESPSSNLIKVGEGSNVDHTCTTWDRYGLHR